MSFIESPDVVVLPEREKPAFRERVRARVSEYPRSVWMVTAAVLAIWTGRGMVTPFLIIYFSQIVGIQSSIVGGIIGGTGLAAVAFVFVAAGQIDKHGGRPVLITTIAAISLATLLSAWAHSVVTFLLVSILLYGASQLYWPAIDTVVASIAEADKVIPAMALVRVGMAVGIGIGGLFGGLLVAGGGLPEYRLLFITSAVLITIGGLIVWRAVPDAQKEISHESSPRGSWGDVLADRTFIYGLLVLFALVLGYTQLNMSVPPFLRAEAGISESTIGSLFFMNTILIVLIQVPIAARVDRGNVGRLLAAASVIWGGAFLTMMITPGIPAAAVLVFIGFTAGQVIFMPLTGILAVRLAPVHLRGRYFALLSITWGSSWAIATLSAGIALDLSRPILIWPVMAALMGAGAVAALRMRSVTRLVPPVKADESTAKAA